MLMACIFGIFQPEYRYDSWDVLLSIALFLQSAFGFYIWAGYLRIAGNERFQRSTVYSFWLASILHHGIWIVLLPLAFGINYWTQNTFSACTLGWLLVNVIVAIFGIGKLPPEASKA